MHYKEYEIEKLALAKKKYDTDKEKDLIKRYKDTKDPFLFTKILYEFKPVIDTAIRKSGNQDVGDSAAVRGRAYEAVKSAVESYNPNMNRKPSSHIHDTIYYALKKAGYRAQNEARMGEQDTIDSGYINIAENVLKREHTPINTVSILNEVTKMKGSKGLKKITTDQIERVKGMQRRSLSGGRIVSGEGEDIRLEDIFNTGGTRTTDIVEDEYDKDIVQGFLARLSPTERGVVKDRHGLGPNTQPEMSWNYVALNNNLSSSYMAKRVYADAIRKLKDMRRT